MMKAEVIKRKRILTEDQQTAVEQAEILEILGVRLRDRRDRPNRKTGKRYYTLFSVKAKLVKEF